jgi:hypothetical protein
MLIHFYVKSSVIMLAPMMGAASTVRGQIRSVRGLLPVAATSITVAFF